jgi:uncharacterized HAD superfamily protein
MKIEDKKSKIGWDIDDIIFPLMKNYLAFHNNKHGTNLELTDVHNYHLWKCGIHNSKEESVKDVLEFQNSPDFDRIDLIPGAREILVGISERFEIHFVTSRPEEIKNKTEILLNKNFPKNGFKILYSGEIYGGNLSKAEICKRNNIPLLIEDNPDYAIDCARNGIRVILLNHPWNANCEKHEKIIRINELKEVLEILK